MAARSDRSLRHMAHVARFPDDHGGLERTAQCDATVSAEARERIEAWCTFAIA